METSLETYTCTRCGDTYSDHVHSYTSTVVPPTCIEDGYTLHECACGHSYRDNTVPKLGHNYVETGHDAIYTYFRCTRCWDERRSPIYIIDPPNPPVVQSLSDDSAASTGCTVRRTLTSTVTEEHSYLYAGKKLLRETITGNGTTKTLDFRYDNVGFPYALIYNNGSSTATYYYITNLQGDVMYLVDSNGNQVAEYSYDPYGKVLSSSGAMAEINPLRYRGYYQDEETGFYYLQSRYYDPAICRFINADSYVSTGQSYLGYNSFAYCGNDPINRTDADGEFWDIVFDVISVGFSIADVIQNPTDPWAWAGLVGDVVDVVVPFVSGVGEVTKSVGAVADVADVIDDVHDTAKAIDRVDDTVDLVDNASDATKAVKNLDLDSGCSNGYCFIAGTLVLTEDGNCAIEEVEIGDYVWAADPETGEVALKQVVQLFRNQTEELTHVFVQGEEIICTPGHPFYSPQYGWIDACELETGDILVLSNGDYVLVAYTYTEQLDEPVAIYNFEVQDFHTYFVGGFGILVHNACTLEEILQDATETTNKKGKTRNFEKAGGYDQALTDFDRLNQTPARTISTKKYGEGLQGTYNGSNVVLRKGSTTGGVTLEIQISHRKSVKIRYLEVM